MSLKEIEKRITRLSGEIRGDVLDDIYYMFSLLDQKDKLLKLEQEVKTLQEKQIAAMEALITRLQEENEELRGRLGGS